MAVRGIPPEERRGAAELVRAWGFPRPIPWHEQADGYWLLSDRGIAWLVRGFAEGHWLLHAMPSPHSGARLPSPEVLLAIRVAAGLIGAARVYAPLGEIRPGWRRWLMRSGFFDGQDDLGPYMELEE